MFLGTAGDSFVVSKQLRSSAGIIVRSGDNQFHIDPGPGSLVRAKEFDVNLRANTAIIATHKHLGHCNDVNAVIDAMTYSGFDKKGVLITNQTVVNGTADMIPYLTKYHAGCVERIVIVEPGKRVGIQDVEITACPAKHSDPHGFGIKMFTRDFVLGYTGDTAYTAELGEAYKGTDILIMNVSHPSGIKGKDEMNTDDAIKLIKKVNPRLAIITHFGLKMLKADPIYEARIIQRETGIQVIAAKDGMVINPVSYSAKSKQKTLLSLGAAEEDIKAMEALESTKEEQG